MRYEIITATDKAILSELIDKNLTFGWILKGGVTFGDGMFAQAISHPSDGDHKPVTSIEEEEDDMEPACVVCGKSDCTDPLHAKISELSGIISGLKKAIDDKQ